MVKHLNYFNYSHSELDNDKIFTILTKDSHTSNDKYVINENLKMIKTDYST